MSNVITADQFSNIYALYAYGRTPLSIEYEEESDDTENVYHDPFCDIFWDELITGFMEVFEKALNPLERDIVIRKAVCEHTFVAISKKHGVSDNTISLRYHKALRKIRRYLEWHGNNRFVGTIRACLADDDSPLYVGTDLCRMLSASKDSYWYKQYILSDEHDLKIAAKLHPSDYNFEDTVNLEKSVKNTIQMLDLAKFNGWSNVEVDTF